MRILLVNTYHFRKGGDSTYTLELAELLMSRGHDVAFFGMQDARNLPDPNADLFVSHIDFRDLNRHKNPISGTRVLVRVIYSREARAKFGKLIGRFQPDVVHLQNVHSHITPSVIFEAKSAGLPVVWTLHDYKLICPNTHFLIDQTGLICEACGKDNYYQTMLKRCKKGSALASSVAALEAYAHRLLRVRERIDAFLTPSAFLKNKLIERGVSSGRIRHIPLFLPQAMFDQSDHEHDEGYMLFLGKLDAIKGIGPLLEACRAAPAVRLILAGPVDQPLANQLPVLLPPNATYVGVRYGQELDQLRRNALAVIVPSLWYENQPFSILEAFASGKPVIASNLGGMAELVGDQTRGVLVPPGNVAELVGAMMWIVAHPKESRAMGRSAYQYAWDNHRPESHLEQLMDTYSQAGAR